MIQAKPKKKCDFINHLLADIIFTFEIVEGDNGVLNREAYFNC